MFFGFSQTFKNTFISVGSRNQPLLSNTRYNIHTMPGITAQWTKVIDSELLQRSSQVVAAINGHAYIFGGELRPREPRDNDIHLVALDSRKPEVVVAQLRAAHKSR